MGQLVAFVVFWGIATSSVYADDITTVTTQANKTYRLQMKSGGGASGQLPREIISWNMAPAGLLESEPFKAKTGFARTVRGTTEIFKNTSESYAVRIEEEGKLDQLPLPPIGSSKSYHRVQRDREGNLYAEILQGGFAFTSNTSDHFPVTAEEVDYSTEGLSTTGKLVANPEGTGAFLLSADGSQLYFLTPPKEWGKEFKVTKMAMNAIAQGNVQRLLILAHDDKYRLGALTTEGALGRLQFEGSPSKKEARFNPIPWPSGVTTRGKIDLRTTLEEAPKGTAFILLPTPSPVVRTIGNDRIVFRAGKLVREDQKGSVIAPPAKSLSKLVPKNSGDGDETKAFIGGIRNVLTDDANFNDHVGELHRYLGRESEVERILAVLTRTTGNHPLLVGDVGAGRASMAPLLAQTLLHAEFPKGTRFHDLFNNAIVVEATPKSLEKAEGGISAYFSGLTIAETNLGRPMVTVISRFNEMSEAQHTYLQGLLASNPKLLVVGVTTSQHLGQLQKREPELLKIFEVIRIMGLGDAETREILGKVMVPSLALAYRTPAGSAVISEEAVDVAIRRAKQIYPGLAFPEAPRRLLEDMVITAHRKAGAKQVTVDGIAARQHIKTALSLAYDPDNQMEFDAAIEGIRARLKEKVVEQDHVVDALVNAFRDIQQPNAKTHHRTFLFLGPTGGGKTFLLKSAFLEFFRDEKRILEIDCTKYLDKAALTTLLGSWPGYIGSEKLGVLPAHLSGNGKNFGGIIFNEWEKASKELANAVMEMFDTGVLTDSHGTRFHVGTAMIGLSSNKGDKVFFPRGAKLTRAEQEARAKSSTKEQVKQIFLEPDQDQRYETANVHTPANVQRIDEAFFILPPSEQGVLKILQRLTIPEIEAELGINVDVDEALLKAIVLNTYQPENGAREPQRALFSLARSSYHLMRKEITETGQNTVTIRLTEDVANPSVNVSIPGSMVQNIPVNFIPTNLIPLEDPKVREKIRTIRARLSAIVFGQDKAIDAVAKSVNNQRYIDPDPVRPGVLGFFGPTGTGKSELAEGIAEVEFGSRDRARSFQMGNIKSMEDVDNLFGTARGRAGSESAAEFEAFIQQYPEGAVLHFEEMGNVGADNPRVRDAVFRILYSILEGKWTSPLGKPYKLGKFFVVFSSNEGQELFADSPADDLRVAVHERSRGQEDMRTLLRKHNWPEPLIGRMQGHLILFKPLLTADRTLIAGKFFNGVLSRLRKRYPVSMAVHQDFLVQAGDIFFSHEQGARAVRDFIEEEVRTLFGEAFTQIYEKYEAKATELLKSSTFSLKLRDNYAGMNYFIGPRPEVRKVMLSLVLTDKTGAVLVSTESDVTEMAPERNLPSKMSLLQTAYHEAGHVVANDPDLTGQETDHVTIVGKGRYGGYARPINLPGSGSFTRSKAVAYLGMLFGGRVTEAYAGYEEDAGWSQDLKMARDLAIKCVSRYGLTDRALGIPMKGDSVDLESDVTRAEIEKLMNDGFRYAATRIQSRWAEIRTVAHALFVKQALNRKSINELLKKARSKTYLDGLKLAHQKEPRLKCEVILNSMGLKELVEK